MARGKVAIAFAHPESVNSWFMHSLNYLITRDFSTNRRIKGRVISNLSGPQIDRARNELVKVFLSQDADWMLMVDADMIFPPEAFEDLFRAADETQRPVIGGLCFGYNAGEITPTIIRFLKVADPATGEVELKIRPILNYPRNEICQVDATGAAFILIHRKVFEDIARLYDGSPAPWFAFAYTQEHRIGEDVNFCMRVAQAGYPIHVHTGVRIGHMKSRAVTEADFDAYFAKVQANGQLEVIRKELVVP